MALESTQPLTGVRLTTLPPSCAVVMQSGNLKFLEPSGPIQACNGIPLPLPQERHTIFPPVLEKTSGSVFVDTQTRKTGLQTEYVTE